MWHRKAMDKEIVEAMATKNFAKSMIKKHRKFCWRGWTHLNATPTLKIVQRLMGHPVHVISNCTLIREVRVVTLSNV